MGYDYDDEDGRLDRVEVDEQAWKKAFEEEQFGSGTEEEPAAADPGRAREGRTSTSGDGTSRARESRASGAGRAPEDSAGGARESRASGAGRGPQSGAGSSGAGRGPQPGVDSSGAGRGSQPGADGAGAGSRPTARSAARQKKAAKNKRKKRIITVIIAEVFALLFIFGYAYAYKFYSMPKRLEFEKKDIKNEELTVDDIKKMQGYWMIAIFGVDSRGSNVGKGTNADVNMIACINQDTGDIKLVSVFRDTYLNIDDKGTYSKINAAYASGGPNQAVKALNKNLDLNITDYITFNWKAVADSINILGGVDVEITKSEFKYINSFITETVESTGVGSHHLKKAGMNHLDGVQAVAYGRLRLMDTDYARTERQRKIIQLAFDKAKKADYSVLNNILVVVLPQVATSLDFVDLTNVALSITKYKLGETGGFPFARGDANMGKRGGACVIPKTLESNVVELHKFLFGDEAYTTTDTVKKISAKIASDTGMYSQGKSQTGSAIPKETKEQKTTEAESTKESTEKESSSAAETDEYGHAVLPNPPETDEYGNVIPGTTPSESSPVRPGETESSSALNPTRPTAPTGPVSPTETSKDNGPTNPTAPTVTTPGKPTETKPSGTKPSESTGGPGEIGSSSPDTTLPQVPTEPETTTGAHPGGTPSSTEGTPGSTPSSTEGTPGSTPGTTPGDTPGTTPGGTPGDVISSQGPGA